MKVTISLFGRFHAFYQAAQLYNHGHLNKLITSYPKFEVKKYGIPANYVDSLLRFEVLDRIWHRKLPSKIRKKFDIVPWFCNKYDQASANKIPANTDVFIGWASKCEQGLKRSKDLGALTIVDRGSSHARYNKDLLQEEYDNVGISKWLPPEEIIEKELREYDLADYILIPSEFVRRSFTESGVSEKKLLKIPYGVDLKSFYPVKKEDDIFRVLYVGGMHIRKGVHYLLKAFAELNLPDAELWLIGSKSLEIQPFFDKYSNCFKYFNHLPQSKLLNYYSQCSVFTICSIEEGMAMVQAQAMACGLPLICTTNSGGGDLIEDGKEGFVLPIRNVEALKEKILWCYENQKLCQAMGEAARKRINNFGTWGDYGTSLIQNLNEKISSFPETNSNY